MVLGSPIFYLKGMRILMFQLSGFCYEWEAISRVTIIIQPIVGHLSLYS